MGGRVHFALERWDLPRHSSHVAQLFSLGGSHMTRKIPTFWLALILGSLSEGAFDGLFALHSSGGPCSGVDFSTLLCVLWHAPGMLISFPLLAMSRPDNRDTWGCAAMGVICIVGALTFTAIYYFIIRRIRRSKHEDTAA